MSVSLQPAQSAAPTTRDVISFCRIGSGDCGVVPTLDENVRAQISLAHGWGDAPGSNADVEEAGTAVNRLIDTDEHHEPVNAMPHMSAIPVNIIALR